MTIQQLKILMELCGGRTLQETADKLNLAQPTVSFHLRKLEETLGLELVRKSSRKLRPTDEALDLLPHIRRIVGLTGQLEEQARDLRLNGGGRLRLGASYAPATFLLPSCFAEFQRLHPRIQLQLAVKQAEKIIDMLLDYELDAAIVALSDEPRPGLTTTRLFADELKLIVASGHPLADAARIDGSELGDELLLLHEQGSTSRSLTDEWLRQTGIRFGRYMELGAIETMKAAVMCNMGVAILPALSVAREVATGAIVQHALPCYVNRRFISLVSRDNEPLSANARLFTEFLSPHNWRNSPLYAIQ